MLVVFFTLCPPIVFPPAYCNARRSRSSFVCAQTFPFHLKPTQPTPWCGSRTVAYSYPPLPPRPSPAPAPHPPPNPTATRPMPPLAGPRSSPGLPPFNGQWYPRGAFQGRIPPQGGGGRGSGVDPPRWEASDSERARGRRRSLGLHLGPPSSPSPLRRCVSPPPGVNIP